MCTLRPVVVHRPPKLRAPREHTGVLIWPEPHAWPALIGRPVGQVRLLDTPLGDLRAALRAELGLTGPVIATGHQCELFHAGVFAKLIAAGQLAARFDGSAVYVQVDSDTPKTTHLRVPTLRDDDLHLERVAIPSHEPQVPIELQPREPATAWDAFFGRVRSLLPNVERTLLETYARGLRAGGGSLVEIGPAVLAAQDATLEALSVPRPRNVPISALAGTRAYCALLGHLLLHARSFAEHYNAARNDFRAHHRVRSAKRPVAPLAIEPHRVELPLWVYREPGPRLGLWVEPRGRRWTLWADHEPIAQIDPDALRTTEGALATLSPRALAPWRIRPRALVLSLMLRLLLSDVLIHGIGGIRYDEMTEQFSQNFFGVTPLPAGCVSATVHVALPYTPVSEATLRAARRALRDVRYNPQRHLRGLPRELLECREALIHKSQRLRRERPFDHQARRRVYLELHVINDQLVAWAGDQVQALRRQVEQLERAWQRQQIATDREYFYALCRRDDLATLTRRLEQAWAEF